MDGLPPDEQTAFKNRPVLGNAALKGLGAAVLAAVAFYYLALFPGLPEAWRKAGSPELYLTGVVGALLLMVSVLFVAVKRGGGGDRAPVYYIAHVLCACAGAVLVVVHGTGNLTRPPALLYLAILGLMALGIWARVRLSRQMSATFSQKHKNFSAQGPKLDKTKLQALINQKQVLLGILDPSAKEGTFSLLPNHWRSKPVASWRYAKLVAEENKLMGTRQAVPVGQGYWWLGHRALAALFVLGVAIHIITVTFFAGYVADYGDITWWHLAAW
jgi:hypothetical protein